jgi:hypothetical protein
MKKLSTGDDATWGNYKKIAIIAFGKNSKPVKYIDERITTNGENSEVLSDETQIFDTLRAIYIKEEDKNKKENPGITHVKAIMVSREGVVTIMIITDRVPYIYFQNMGGNIYNYNPRERPIDTRKVYKLARSMPEYCIYEEV